MNGAAVVAEILKREGTEFLSCYPRNPIIEPCAALGIRPILCRQERVGVGLADGYTPHQARQEERRVRGAGRPRHRERLSGRRPGLRRERADADRLRRPAAGAAIPAAGVPRRRRLPPGDQMVGAGAQRAGIARPDAARLSRHALGQGRPGADRDSRRGGRGRVQGRARLHAGAGAAHGARSGRGEEGRADAARGQESADPGRAGRALRRSRRAAGGACRAHSRAGRHHQSGQERDRRKPSAVARRLDALAAEDVHRLHGQGRCGARDRLEPDQDAVRSGRAAGQDHHPFDQRRGRHQQGVPRRSRRGRRRGARARCADRRSVAPEGRRAAAMRSIR